MLRERMARQMYKEEHQVEHVSEHTEWPVDALQSGSSSPGFKVWRKIPSWGLCFLSERLVASM